MNREQEPATEKQAVLIQDLGLTLPSNCTVAQASDIIALAQIIRHFALLVARQTWKQDIASYDLRPIIRSILWTPELADQIQDIMDAHSQAAWVAREVDEQIQAAGAPSDNRTPELSEDKYFAMMKTKLEYHFPALTKSKPVTPPPIPPAAPQPKVFLASDSGIVESVRTWVDGFRKK